MRIAIHIPVRLPFSIKSYIHNIMVRLTNEGLKLYTFSSPNELGIFINNVDLVWFPACGRSAPALGYLKYLKSKKVILTFHGAVNLSMPIRLVYDSFFEQVKFSFLKYVYKFRWKKFIELKPIIIAVSKYARSEFLKIFGYSNIVVIYHGVDHDVFAPSSEHAANYGYLLHISQYQPMKNIDRIIAAYNMLSEPKPLLKLLVPGYKHHIASKKIKVMSDPITNPFELVELYHGAIAFIFPSIRETFGMPILEAMACGCPVITSNRTACAEIAGDSALLVDPFCVKDISNAMEKLLRDCKLRLNLVKKGLERVKDFTWEKSAKKHLELFEEILKRN